MQQSALRRSLLVALGALVLACSSGGSSSSSPPPLPPNTEGWWRDKVVYEIFVRSFADVGSDGIGDLAGLTAHLPDLNDGDPATTTDLGVDAIWLMPIYPSPSYHGYDVLNYQDVKYEYGTLADLDALVTAAHARGIKVLLDFVPNHTSNQHPWFVNAQTGTGAAKRDWYVWSATLPTSWPSPMGGYPWHAGTGGFFYGLFNGGMPDLNWRNAATEADVVASMKFWLARGVDGFRLDAVRYLVENGPAALQDQPETHAALKRVRAALQAEYPQALLVGEAWADEETVATYYGAGDELQLAFSFDLADAVKRSAVAGDPAAVVNALAVAEAVLGPKDRGFEAPFLSNHDQVRVMRALGGDAAAARLAAATLFAMPGTPFVYYGEEIGMQGGASSDDKDKRTPMRWTATEPYGFTTGQAWYASTESPGVDVATQRADPSSLWNLYRRLIALRHGEPALASVEAVRPAVTGAGASGVLALLRGAPGHRVLFVANYATAAAGPLDVALGAAATAASPAVLEAEGLSGAPSAAGSTVTLPGLGPRAFAFVSLD